MHKTFINIITHMRLQRIFNRGFSGNIKRQCPKSPTKANRGIVRHHQNGGKAIIAEPPHIIKKGTETMKTNQKPKIDNLQDAIANIGIRAEQLQVLCQTITDTADRGQASDLKNTMIILMGVVNDEIDRLQQDVETAAALAKPKKTKEAEIFESLGYSAQ